MLICDSLRADREADRAGQTGTDAGPDHARPTPAPERVSPSRPARPPPLRIGPVSRIPYPVSRISVDSTARARSNGCHHSDLRSHARFFCRHYFICTRVLNARSGCGAPPACNFTTSQTCRAPATCAPTWAPLSQTFQQPSVATPARHAAAALLIPTFHTPPRHTAAHASTTLDGRGSVTLAREC